MTAIEIIQTMMSDSDTTFKDLADYGDLGTRENVYPMRERSDLKVGTFVKMLEVMGYQLIVQSEETEEEFIVDYEE